MKGHSKPAATHLFQVNITDVNTTSRLRAKRALVFIPSEGKACLSFREIDILSLVLIFLASDLVGTVCLSAFQAIVVFRAQTSSLRCPKLDP